MADWKEVAFWLVLFMCCSTTMAILNRRAGQAFPAAITLVFLQNAATLLLALTVGNTVGRSNSRFGFKVPLTWRVVQAWLPATAIYSLMLVASVIALRETSVAFSIVMRSLTPMLTALLEQFLGGKNTHWRVWLSLISILIGALMFMMGNSATYP